MWQENLIIIIVLFAGLFNLILAAYVFRNGPKKRLNRNFSYLGFVLFFWCLSNFVSLISENIFWIRLSYALGLAVVLFSFFLAAAIANRAIAKTVKAALFFVSVILFIISFSPQFLSDVTSYGAGGITARFGPLFVWWEIFMLALGFVGLYLPISALPSLDEHRKKQVAYFYVGCLAFGVWSLVTSVILPFFGYNKLLNFDTPSTIFLTGFTSYAIVRYQIMEIKSLFFKAFIYSFIIGFISGFLALLVSLESWFFDNLGREAAYLISAVTSLIIFLIGRSFYNKTKDLETAKISLTQMLERSEADRLLAEEEKNKTLTIINNFSDGLLIIDKEKRIIIMNPQAESYLGLEASRLLGKRISKELESLIGFKEITGTLAVKDKALAKKELELGKDLIVEVSIVKFNLKRKSFSHLVILHDITQAKVVEELKTEFVTLAAHQLRTPLTAIKWSSQMLLAGELGEINPDQHEYIDKISISTQRMIGLINDLLNVAHLEEGRYSYKLSKFMIEDLLQIVLANVKEKADARKIKLLYRQPAQMLPSVSADREKIEIVMQNFIENAINYSFDGGSVSVSIESDGGSWTFKVADSGIGISEGSKGRIFGKFFRSDEAFKKNTEGSGLGLFMCKNIIEGHGGNIGFDSSLGKGSTFYFTLPFEAVVKETAIK